MRNAAFTCSLVVLSALLSLAPGCSCNGDDSPAVDSGPGDGDCTLGQEGDECTDNVECCSAFCDDGQCSPQAGNCDDVGAACAAGSTCCSGRCGEDGTCAAGVASCQPLGGSCDTAADCCSLGCDAGECGEELCATIEEECTGDSDCCSNDCDPDSGKCKFMGMCRPAGETCMADSGCCSQNCVDFGDGDMRCAAGGICRPGGEVCTENNDCCSFSCLEGYCEILDQCPTVGEPCVTDTECCSFACEPDPTGANTCHYLGGCRPYGELCRKDSDCCNDQANGGPGVCQIFNADAGIGTCGNPGACAASGEVCGVEGSEAGSNECCPGHDNGGDDLCIETDYGVFRCLGGFDCIQTGDGGCVEDLDCCESNCVDGSCEPFECIGDGETCNFSDQCCSGICAPDENGDLVCSPGCIPIAGDCTADGDCCDGAYCDTQTLTCLDNGGVE
jgi:hypothetical protein